MCVKFIPRIILPCSNLACFRSFDTRSTFLDSDANSKKFIKTKDRDNIFSSKTLFFDKLLNFLGKFEIYKAS